MRFLKWFLLVAVALVALLAALLFAAPSLFGDRIRAAVDEQLARYVDADVTYGEVDLSLLRDFPKLSFVVEDLGVAGRGVFDTVRLAGAEELAVAVDFWSVLGDGPVAVRGVELVRPRLHVVTLADGSTNTDILRNLAEAADTASASGGSVRVALDRYAVVAGEVIYDDRAGDVYAHAVGLDHEGSGDLTDVRYVLETATTVRELTVRSGGATYLRRAGLRYDANLDVDAEAGTVQLADNDLTINELHVGAEGTVGFPTETGDIPIDLRFSAPQQDFRALWSIIPAEFARDLAGLQTSGSFSLGGVVDGTYRAASGALPGFAVDLTVADASVQYPDLPQALRDIDVRAGVRSAGADLSDLLVDVPSFAFRLGDNPFSGRLKLRQGATDPAFDLVAKGRIDLADVSAALPIEGVEQLSGLVVADVAAVGRASAVEADLRSIQATGTASVRDIVYDAIGMPKVEVRRGGLRFSGSEVVVEEAEVLAGHSDLLIDGVLTDPFALATETGMLGGRVSVRSRTLDANEWLAEPEGDPAGGTATGVDPVARPFDRFDVDFDARVERLEYDVYVLTDATARGAVSSDRLRLDAAQFSLEGSPMRLSGQLDNLYGFSFDGGVLTGDLALVAGELDLLALSEIGLDPAAPAASAAEAEYLALPERMNLRIDTRAERLLYDGVALDDVTGVVVVADQGAVIENGRGGALGGQLAIDGSYVYNGPDREPTFELKYDLQQASFRRAFEQLNTVQRLAPIAQYLDGTFNTNLVMAAALGKDFLPVLTSLDADGFLNTLDATLKQFGPLTQAADKLNVQQLREIRLKNTKNWFTVDDGTVTVRPFDLSWQGIDATVGGTHGLDQAMDYEIVALIPRELIGKTAVGAAANQGLEFLSGQASRLGLNLDAGEFVRVRIGLTGSLTDPKVAVKLLGTEGEGTLKDAAAGAVKDLAKQARDSVERVAQAKLDAAKAHAEARADSVRRAAEARARAAADEAKANAEAEARRLANQAAEEAKRKAGEEAKKAAEAAAQRAGEDAKDKAKDALKGLLGGKKKPD